MYIFRDRLDWRTRQREVFRRFSQLITPRILQQKSLQNLQMLLRKEKTKEDKKKASQKERKEEEERTKEMSVEFTRSL